MKKTVLALISAVCVGTSALGLTACVPEGLGGHNWSESWRHTIDYHWHACTDTGCSARDQYEFHNLMLVETYEGREATCGKAGRGIWQCVDCGVTVEDVIPATGEHSYVLAYADIEATCEIPGHGTYVCEVCGDIISQEIPSSDAHVYSVNWTANADGHYHACEICGEPDEVIPHTEIRSTSLSKPVQGNNDGLSVYICGECGEFLRDDPLVNPNVPASLTVSFQGVPYDVDEYGIVHVTFARGQQYAVNCTAKTAAGVTVPNNVDAAFQSGYDGIRAYLMNDITGEEEWLTLSNMGTVAWTGYNIAVNRTGIYTVVFKFETGGLYNDGRNPDYRARAEVVVQIECV